MDHLKRAGLSEEHARAYTEALEEALRSTAVKTDRDVMSALLRNVRTAADRIQTRRVENAQKGVLEGDE
jgi:truncated hemoglobin YjbI